VGTVAVNPYVPMEHAQNGITATYTRQSDNPSLKYAKDILSTLVVRPAPEPVCKAIRLTMKARSSLVRKEAVSGRSGRRKYSVKLIATGTRPSRMKIHLTSCVSGRAEQVGGNAGRGGMLEDTYFQPARPLTPSMFSMAKARRPEKAPDKDAEA
jgi:hypothetical protein